MWYADQGPSGAGRSPPQWTPVELGDLTEGERRLMAAFPRGAAVDLGGGDPTREGAAAADWSPDQQVRSEVVAGLLLGMVDGEPGRAPQLDLAGARITGRLDLTGAVVPYGLRLARCWLDEPVEARDAKLRVVSLVRCRVPAFHGMAMQVDGALALTGSRLGTVALADATIAGRLHMTGAHLSESAGYAFLGTRLSVAQSAICHDLTVTGRVRLLDAQIGGALIFSGARLSNPHHPPTSGDESGGIVLDMHGIRVGQGVDLDEGFTAVGDVRLRGARVDGQLHVAAEVAGTLDLRRAQVQSLRLKPANAAPTRLDGLDYADLKPDEPATSRLGWLRRDPDGYRAQPYEQLATQYRRLGHDEQARRVLLAKRRAYRSTRSWWWRLPGLVVDGLAGYGYAPGRAVCWLCAAWLVGWWYFAAAGSGPPDPALYALDLLLPTAPFGLEGRFPQQGPGLWVAAVLQVLGWALSLAVLPAVARAFNRT